MHRTIKNGPAGTNLQLLFLMSIDLRLPAPREHLGRNSLAHLFTVAALFALLALPASAQVRSKASQITLIAKMPESIGIRANTDTTPNDNLAVPRSQSVMNNVTTAWCLARGRARVVTLARVKNFGTPALIALALPSDIGVRPEAVSDIPLRFGLATGPQVSNAQLNSVNLTDANRVTTNTISISDAIPSSGQAQDDGYNGLIKIQFEAVP